MNNDDIVAELTDISERLSDRAISLLRDAMSGEHPSAQKDEKRVTQARRAVEKAIHLLSGLREE